MFEHIYLQRTNLIQIKVMSHFHCTTNTLLGYVNHRSSAAMHNGRDS
jgi:hypothetical protein